MTNHLIPEKRVNKLGHVVTKHVKPTSAGSVSDNLPLIVLRSGDRSVRVSTLTSRFYNRGMELSEYSPNEGKKNKDEIRATLSEFSDSTLERLENMPSNADGVMVYLLLEKKIEQTINDFIAVMPMMERALMGKSEIVAYLYSLSVTEELEQQGEDGEYPAERGEQCASLIEVLTYMDRRQVYRINRTTEDGSEYPFIDDAKLRELVVTSGNRRDAVVQLIVDRDIIDADHIAGLLDNDVHPTLLEGGL